MLKVYLLSLLFMEKMTKEVKGKGGGKARSHSLHEAQRQQLPHSDHERIELRSFKIHFGTDRVSNNSY